nr:hypothetical protein [Tanacetum cinerariifolium]
MSQVEIRIKDTLFVDYVLYVMTRSACSDIYLVFVDLVISTQADGAQSPRETPESPYTVASPTSLLDTTPLIRHVEDSVDSDTSGARPTPSDFTAPLSLDRPVTHASPTLVPILCRTTRMTVRVPPTMAPGLSASIADMAAMCDSAFRKRFRSFYEISPSSSPPYLPSDPAVGDECLATRDEGLDMRVESLGLGGDATVPKGQERVAPVVETDVGEPLGLGYGALRRREIAYWEGWMPWVFKTPPYPEWSSGSLHVSPAPSIVPFPPTMAPGLSASIADMAAMCDSAFRKRFRSFYEISPSSSPPYLPSKKRYRSTSELVEDEEEEEENDEEDDE